LGASPHIFGAQTFRSFFSVEMQSLKHSTVRL
jgi:hypothetical protein